MTGSMAARRLNSLLICGFPMKRAVLYLQVSTTDQTTANQEQELRQAAERAGWEIVHVYKDHGISGAKGRDKRPAFDALQKAAARREFNVIMAWRWHLIVATRGLINSGLYTLFLQSGFFRDPLSAVPTTPDFQPPSATSG